MQQQQTNAYVRPMLCWQFRLEKRQNLELYMYVCMYYKIIPKAHTARFKHRKLVTIQRFINGTNFTPSNYLLTPLAIMWSSLAATAPPTTTSAHSWHTRIGGAALRPNKCSSSCRWLASEWVYAIKALHPTPIHICSAKNIKPLKCHFSMQVLWHILCYCCSVDTSALFILVRVLSVICSVKCCCCSYAFVSPLLTICAA